MDKEKKKVIITILIVVSIVAFFSSYKNILNKEELPKVKLQEIKDTESFAIMVPNNSGDGYEEYKSEEDLWPGEDYYFGKAECVDNEGNKVKNSISFDDKTRKAILKSKNSIYCTLYFDKYNYMKVPLQKTGKSYGGDEEIIPKYMKANIKNVYFVNYIDLNKAIEHWNIGDTNMGTAENSVVAWTEQIVNDNQYINLYIGSKNKIRVLDLSNAFMGTERDMTKGQIPAQDIYLETIDFGNQLDTSKTTSMFKMFFCDSHLTTIKGAENLDTSNVVDMGFMFYYNSSLTEFNILSNWDVSNLASVRWMFQLCINLKSIDLHNWSMEKVSNFNGMFYRCGNLNYIDMRNANFLNAPEGSGIFNNISANARLIVKNNEQKNWLTSKNLFSGTIEVAQ